MAIVLDHRSTDVSESGDDKSLLDAEVPNHYENNSENAVNAKVTLPPTHEYNMNINIFFYLTFQIISLYQQLEQERQKNVALQKENEELEAIIERVVQNTQSSNEPVDISNAQQAAKVMFVNLKNDRT